MSPFNKYQQSKEAGYNDDEIIGFLSQSPEYAYKIKQSKEAGYNDGQIAEFLSQQSQSEQENPNESERSTFSNIARAPLQYGLGAAQATVPGIVYEVATAPLASKDAQTVNYREEVFNDIQRLQDQKQSGVWDEKDQELYDSLVNQIKNPQEAEKFVQTADVGFENIVKKTTGIDLDPDGVVEKASRWAGWIRNPRSLLNLKNIGSSKAEIAKWVAPTGKEALRGAAAGKVLQEAEDGDFGPIGTIGASIFADLATGSLVNAAKRGASTIMRPKETIAKAVASFTPAEKKAVQQEIIKDFRKAGMEADIGTLTDNNLIRVIQTKLSQSGLSGDSLNKLKNRITEQVTEGYSKIADKLGKAKYTTTHEAGQEAKRIIKSARDADLEEVRKIYSDSKSNLKEGTKIYNENLVKEVEKLQKELAPGSIKSPEQKVVINELEKIYNDLRKVHPEGKGAFIEDLVNNKIALNDIINYELQGGSKQLLKGLVSEIDRAIISSGKENKKFVDSYIKANRRFSDHAKTYRNKNIDQVLRSQDPATILNKMNSIQGIRDIENSLKSYKGGSDFFNDLKRFKLDQVIEKNLIDSTTRQLKLGQFSKLLEKSNNREIVKEILGNESFKKLQSLQKNAGRLAESANKFYNSSNTATQAADAAVILQMFKSVGYLLSGNPWPLLKTAGGIAVFREVSKLIADPKFLKLTEEAILASKSNNPTRIKNSMEKLKPYAMQIRKVMYEKNET